MEDNKRLERIERRLEEINDKLDILLEMQGVVGFKKVSVKINPSIKKEIKIPKDVQLDNFEKQVVKEIYKSGLEGISATQIAQDTKISRKTVSLLIAGMMSKGIPIQSTNLPNRRYRFEQKFIEIQAKKNFLKLTER